jgi:hypothetical protein
LLIATLAHQSIVCFKQQEPFRVWNWNGPWHKPGQTNGWMHECLIIVQSRLTKRARQDHAHYSVRHGRTVDGVSGCSGALKMRILFIVASQSDTNAGSAWLRSEWGTADRRMRPQTLLPRRTRPPALKKCWHPTAQAGSQGMNKFPWVR